MGRSISPLLQRELANLDDASSRHSAMKALKSYVRDLDSKAIPRFLAQVSDKDPGSPPGECTISLYEVLARVHGPKIVPQIDNIMSTIMRTLSSSAGSFPLHQACSRVVPAIARYAIEPSTPSDEKTRIIRTLYKPLCAALMGLQESVTTGAALCLTAVVEADNWRFATDEMVNEVCLKVAGALEEKATQTNYHMGLVVSLAKHNTLVAEAYARCFLRSGLQILSIGISESNTQKRLCAIQMISCLMSCVDSRSISSELGKVVDAMEERRTDQFQFVRVAAWETLQTARAIAGQKGPRQGILLSPRMDRSGGATDDESTGENDGPAGYHSPESHTVDSFVRFDNFVESPKSIGQLSANSMYARRANRRLWSNDNGSVDVSLKDGLLLRTRSVSEISEVELEPHMNDEEHNDAFMGFGQMRASREARSATPTPQKLGAQLNFDDVKIYSTPRKLIRSLQDQTYVNSRGSVLKSPTSDEVEQNVKVALCGTTHSHNLISDVKERRYAEKARMIGTENGVGVDDSGVFMDGTESASSTGDLSGNCSCKVSSMDCEDKIGAPRKSVRRIMFAKTTLGFGLLLIFVAIILSSMRMNNEDLHFVPT